MIAPESTISWKLRHVSGRCDTLREGMCLSRMYPLPKIDINASPHQYFTTFLSNLESSGMESVCVERGGTCSSTVVSSVVHIGPPIGLKCQNFLRNNHHLFTLFTYFKKPCHLTPNCPSGHATCCRKCPPSSSFNSKAM